MARSKKDDGVNRTSSSEEGNERGRPSDTGKTKAEVKNILNPDDPEHQKLEEETGDLTGLGDVSPDALKHSHPNRNTDKPDIDKPAYS